MHVMKSWQGPGTMVARLAYNDSLIQRDTGCRQAVLAKEMFTFSVFRTSK